MPKQRLKKISKFREEHFEKGSAPSAKTVIKCINEGSLPGRKIGGDYYIDMVRYEKTTGNPLVDKILIAA